MVGVERVLLDDKKQCKFVETIKNDSHCYLFCFLLPYHLVVVVVGFCVFLFCFFLFLVLFVFNNIYSLFSFISVKCTFNVYLELYSRIRHTMSSLYILGHAILYGALNCC